MIRNPYGYKDTRPSHIKNIIENKDAEVLWFLPIAQMYRFAGTSLSNPSPDLEPLKLFLEELFDDQIPKFESPHDFISQLKDRFKIYLKHHKVFVDTFTIERSSTSVYCLFFFTNHILGFEKMLEAKWDLDPQAGQGHKMNRNPQLFREIELQRYPQRLRMFLQETEYKTNDELYLFGLENGFLPKHTTQELKGMGNDIEVREIDGKLARKNAYYIGTKKIVHIYYRPKPIQSSLF